MPGKLLNLDDSMFSSEISKGVTLVDFWAPWCNPCQIQSQILEQLADTLNGKAKIAKVNIDDFPSIAGSLNIQAIPTLIIFKDGKEAQRFIGVQTAEILTNAVSSFT